MVALRGHVLDHARQGLANAIGHAEIPTSVVAVSEGRLGAR
jgi:hypothetical protein